MWYWLKELFEDRTFGAKRSGQWSKIRAKHLEENPLCAVCGTRGSFLSPNQVHHKSPFHLKPALELEPANLITLCEEKGCHLRFGHLYSFKSYNPNIESDSNKWRLKIKNRP